MLALSSVGLATIPTFLYTVAFGITRNELAPLAGFVLAFLSP